MSCVDLKNCGTGLREVHNILVKAPKERLLSLTLELGTSPEDTIIQAMCLIILQRRVHALDKLQMWKDKPLAKHLGEEWDSSRSGQDDFRAHCERFQPQTGECLSLLARVFKVLSEKGLCEPFVRNLAYKRAISSESLKTELCGNLGYHEFREEAKTVCGPQFAQWMCSLTDHSSDFSLHPHGSPSKVSAGLKVTECQNESARIKSLPSPLQDSPSELSYPSHLEISFPPTASFQGDRREPEASGTFESRKEPEQLKNSLSGLDVFGLEKLSSIDESCTSMKSEFKSLVQPNKPSPESMTSTSATSSTSAKTYAPEEAEEDGEETFYAFVILHAPEDEDMAESIKKNCEKVINNKGAIFSEEFAIAGKSTLKCVEDAVNNSAFTFLLLTRNFNTKMLEVNMNIALINSINNSHKFNTVIPLLPINNPMPKGRIPIALQTLVALDERRNFEEKLRRSLSPSRIAKQKKIWSEEQKVKKELLKLQELQRRILRSSMSLEHRSGDSRPWCPQQSNIHIENANYVLIGNDSNMTVGSGGSAEK